LSDIGKKLVAGLEEFAKKLRDKGGFVGIEVTRGEKCPNCSNDPELKKDCETCKGLGFIFYKTML
jgi:DnaJ-class molecular chaperone